MKIFLIFGAIFGFLGVLAGALGAHGLRARLEAQGGLENFFRATDYLFVHALALVLVSILVSRFPEAKFHWAGWAWILGSFLFQGSLMGWSLTGLSLLRHVAPLGGLCLMAGWILLLGSAFGLKN